MTSLCSMQSCHRKSSCPEFAAYRVHVTPDVQTYAAHPAMSGGIAVNCAFPSIHLLELDHTTGSLDGLLQFLSILLAQSLLQHLWCGLDELLRLHQVPVRRICGMRRVVSERIRRMCTQLSATYIELLRALTSRITLAFADGSLRALSFRVKTVFSFGFS